MSRAEGSGAWRYLTSAEARNRCCAAREPAAAASAFFRESGSCGSGNPTSLDGEMALRARGDKIKEKLPTADGQETPAMCV